MTPEQSRAPRGGRGWSQKQLAERAGVALNTVYEFEKGRRTPAAYIITAMRGVIEAEGIRLLFDQDGAGAGIVRQGARIDPSALSSD
jgi:transcriptional regulator with XRE-family HTH domain